MEEGRGEEGSETGAAWDGRSGDKLSDTVEFATESGFECPCGGGGELFLDGERREEKRDREEGREGGREGGGGRRRGPFVPRPSTSEDRSTNRRRRKTEAFEVEVGKRSAEGGGEWRLAGLRLPARWREMLEGSENACASAENDCDPDDRGGQERK